MSSTVRQARIAAAAFARAGEGSKNLAQSLAAWEEVLAAVPHDIEPRLRIAELLVLGGAREEGATLYRTLSDHAIKAGHPFAALLGAKALAALGHDLSADEIYGQLGEVYGAGAPTLARMAARQGGADLDAAIKPFSPAVAEPPPDIAARAHTRAMSAAGLPAYPKQLHPAPFLSELEPGVLVQLARAVGAKRFHDGDIIVKQGDPGSAFYLVASGELVVTIHAGTPEARELAVLGPGALFGEMALLTEQHRTASVLARGPVEVIEVSREVMRAVSKRSPEAAAALDRFGRERLLRNVFATSPLFRPFSREQQRELLKHFEGHEVDAGVEIIREGEMGEGVYVMLSGEVEVSKQQADGTTVSLAKLRPGDVFGEMSLLLNQVTSATVRATRSSAVLFLDSQYFQRLVGAIPELRETFEKMAKDRDRDTTTRVGEDVIIDDD